MRLVVKDEARCGIEVTRRAHSSWSFGRNCSLGGFKLRPKESHKQSRKNEIRSGFFGFSMFFSPQKWNLYRWREFSGFSSFRMRLSLTKKNEIFFQFFFSFFFWIFSRVKKLSRNRYLWCETETTHSQTRVFGARKKQLINDDLRESDNNFSVCRSSSSKNIIFMCSFLRTSSTHIV